MTADGHGISNLQGRRRCQSNTQNRPNIRSKESSCHMQGCRLHFPFNILLNRQRLNIFLTIGHAMITSAMDFGPSISRVSSNNQSRFPSISRVSGNNQSRFSRGSTFMDNEQINGQPKRARPVTNASKNSQSRGKRPRFVQGMQLQQLLKKMSS